MAAAIAVYVIMTTWIHVFFFQAEDGIRDHCVTGVQTCALPISSQTAHRAKRQPWHERRKSKSPQMRFLQRKSHLWALTFSSFVPPPLPGTAPASDPTSAVTGSDRVWCSGKQGECPLGAEFLQNCADQLEQVGRQQSPAQEYSREAESHTCCRRQVPRAHIAEAISSCVRLRSCRRKPLP